MMSAAEPGLMEDGNGANPPLSHITTKEAIRRPSFDLDEMRQLMEQVGQMTLDGAQQLNVKIETALASFNDQGNQLLAIVMQRRSRAREILFSSIMEEIATSLNSINHGTYIPNLDYIYDIPYKLRVSLVRDILNMMDSTTRAVVGAMAQNDDNVTEIIVKLRNAQFKLEKFSADIEKMRTTEASIQALQIRNDDKASMFIYTD